MPGRGAWGFASAYKNTGLGGGAPDRVGFGGGFGQRQVASEAAPHGEGEPLDHLERGQARAAGVVGVDTWEVTGPATEQARGT